MQITTEPTVEISDCPQGCGEPVSLTMNPTPMFVKIGDEMQQVYVPGKTVHLTGYVQCAKKCKACGENGYLKHITTHMRKFVHTATQSTECAQS